MSLVPDDPVKLPANRKGSRLRCLMLISQPREQVARCLTAVTGNLAQIVSGNLWLPRGFSDQREAVFNKAEGLLSDREIDELKNWWLVRKPLTTRGPNWDVTATAMIERRKGLLLIEAKAHEAELNDQDCTQSTYADNKERIGKAISEATSGLNELKRGVWSLSSTNHYQLANRFAWSWKLATMGIPVVLVYFGFLNAEEMSPRSILTSHDQWEKAVRRYAEHEVPAGAWGQRLDVNGTPLTALICSMDQKWSVNAPA